MFFFVFFLVAITVDIQLFHACFDEVNYTDVIKKVKKRIAVSGIPSHSYETSLAIWDHTVLPATRHK